MCADNAWNDADYRQYSPTRVNRPLYQLLEGLNSFGHEGEVLSTTTYLFTWQKPLFQFDLRLRLATYYTYYSYY